MEDEVVADTEPHEQDDVVLPLLEPGADEVPVPDDGSDSDETRHYDDEDTNAFFGIDAVRARCADASVDCLNEVVHRHPEPGFYLAHDEGPAPHSNAWYDYEDSYLELVLGPDVSKWMVFDETVEALPAGHVYIVR